MSLGHGGTFTIMNVETNLVVSFPDLGDEPPNGLPIHCERRNAEQPQVVRRPINFRGLWRYGIMAGLGTLSGKLSGEDPDNITQFTPGLAPTPAG